MQRLLPNHTRVKDHTNYWVDIGGRLTLTFEPYLSADDPCIEADLRGPVEAGWSAEVLPSPYSPYAIMVLLTQPEEA